MKINIILLLSFVFVQAAAHAQQDFPSVKLKNTAGKTIDFADLIREAKDTTLVFSFWATWCIPCVTELDNISDEYKEKQSSMNFKFYGVSIDDSRTTKRVKPFIQGKGWTFDVMMDVNSELKRALKHPRSHPRSYTKTHAHRHTHTRVHAYTHSPICERVGCRFGLI